MKCTIAIAGRMHCAALLVAFSCALSCGKREADDASGGSVPEATVARALGGRYIDELSLVGDSWHASGPAQQIALTFHTRQLSQVRQFEIVLEPVPADAFDFSSAVFTAAQPFSTFGSGVDAGRPGQLRIGGATFGGNVSGDHTLGTLRMLTGDSFSSEIAARINVRLLSLGPRSDQREVFEGDKLDLGVDVN